MKKQAYTVSGAGTCLLLLLLLPALVPAAVAKEKTEAIEAYQGHTINPNSGGPGTRPNRGPGRRAAGPAAGGGSTFVNIEIDRWTTDEERDNYLGIISEQGSEAFIDSMRDEGEKVGWIRLPGTTSYDLKFARTFETPEGRLLILATDRPVAMAELRRGSRSMDYGATVIMFTMPADGKEGEGSIIVGAEVEMTPDGQLSLETASASALQLSGVKRTQ